MDTSLADFQAGFAAALRDRAPDAAPGGLAALDAQRFRVYRNNYRVALCEALAAAYPTVRCIVGDAFFAGLAGSYADATPPRARTLNHYGEGFPDFIAGFAPAGELPYLADVARLERAVLEARHAADAVPLDPTDVAVLGPALATARLTPHPAARLVRSGYPIADIWHANSDSREPTEDVPQTFRLGAAGALVARPHLMVSVQALEPAADAFVGALFDGAGLDVAHERAVAVDAGFDVMATFRELLSAGVFCAIVADDSPHEE